MFPRFWLPLLVVSGFANLPARAQMLEASLTAAFTVRGSVRTSGGDTIASYRIGTKEIIEAFEEAIGVSGSRVSLVNHREIGDLREVDSRVLLLVDGRYYDITDQSIHPVGGLPAGFVHQIGKTTLRPIDGRVSSFTQERTTGVVVGDLASAGFEITLLGLAKRSARLLTQDGVDVGYVITSQTLSGVGGIEALHFAGASGRGTVSGSLRQGAERILAP